MRTDPGRGLGPGAGVCRIIGAMSDAVAIIANPYSGALSNRPRVEALCAALRRAGVTPTVYWDITEAATSLSGSEYGTVVAAGGDGTAAAVINLQPVAPLYVFPLGTENLLAQALGHTSDPDAASARIAGKRSRRIDLGCARHDDGSTTWFSLMCSAGYDASVAHRLARWRSAGAAEGLRRVRRRSYARHIVSEAVHYGFPMVDIDTPDGTIRGAHVFVFSISRYFSGLNFAPCAADDDGHLHYIILRRPGRINLLRYTNAIRLGRHHRLADVATGTARALSLRVADGYASVPLQIDGEAVGSLPAALTIHPGRQPVIM